jgi:small subunit ribosomal protein S20
MFLELKQSCSCECFLPGNPRPQNFGISAIRAYLCRPKINSGTMANHNSTKKDVRQSTKRRERNKYFGKTTRNAIRDFKELTGDKVTSEKVAEVFSQIDKLAKRGVIHKNKAANIKSGLAKKLNVQFK